ncbi:cytidine deaminase [Legionella maioricensis]|uniref:Cytidine deaminase n=1 Tax=Legionella maioricensis TaxID=2896528 RepID=A0A9X2D145_9GAMM|nr:cytidine deaminase [Legionella maioricensis]MCL9684258.1 cytidine deaminase [Legionella maioricensis]MCL9687124.1 cytidine deaminase [Legionella maioricensis]
MNKITEQMISEAYKALPNAYAPYSQFKVASCICTDKNNLYTGVNVENGSYGLTNCAESSAICNMVLAGEQRIKSIVILADNHLPCSPCGACRQRIHEFSTADTVVHLCNENTIFQSLTIDKLLPLAFDFNP